MHWSGVCCIHTQEWLLLATCLSCHLVLACDSGWFGSSCQFRCHCAAASCDTQGKCLNGPCAPGYFGPACQYVDLVYDWRADNTSQYLYDQNEDTCNEEPMASEVAVVLKRTFRFSWLRIVARVLVQHIGFQLLLDAKEDICKYKRDFYVDNVTVDVTCDSTPLVTHLLIRGDIVHDVCSVYISGGPQYKLNMVDVVTVNEIRMRVNTYLNLTCVGGVCEVVLNSSEPSISVVISSSLPLALCQVQVFGETLCPDRNYGLECDQPCSCKATEICSLVTGTCSDGCPGYYGYECDKLCGVSCVDSLCWHLSGDCVDCQPGYHGRLCADACPDGKYGKNCLYECSPRCLDQKCKKVDGICLRCNFGRSGPFCQVLDETDYGMWPYVIVVAGCILLSLCCMCFRRAQLQQTTDGGQTLPVEAECPEPKEEVKEKEIPPPRSETSV